MTATILISKLLDHLCNHSKRYLFSILIAFLIFGLLPFNFTEKNNAVISPAGGLEIARHGTAYSANSPVKLQGLNQFAIYVDITTSSDGLSSFEKIFSYFVNQEEMNFLFGQWKDGFLPVLRADQKSQTIKLGVGDALRKGERSRFLLSYDGKKLRLYQDGIVRNSRDMGALTFSSWDKTYPLVVGMDATGRSQWKGTLYEIAMWDRSLKPEAVADYTRQAFEGNRQQATGQIQNSDDKRPLIHYAFSLENSYETTFRGKRALGVRDLGKGDAADLVIPEQFMPYQRVYLGWDPDWTRKSSDWIDVIVNVLGFVPFGFLLLMQFANRKKGFGLRASGVGIENGNRDSDFGQCRRAAGLRDSGSGILDQYKTVIAVILVVVAGFVVSLAIELLQAYLPSRDSNLRDLITNVLGTFIGALGAVWTMSRQKTQL